MTDLRRKYDWKKIQEEYDKGFSLREVSEKFNVNMSTINRAKNRGEFNTRTKSEARILASKKKPQKHSQKTRDKISKARREYLRKNPDKVPYKLNHYTNGESYPEEYFRKWLKKEGIEFKQQFGVGLYSLDFLIGNIDLEIDGDQHYLDERIIDSDKRRTIFLEGLGFTTYRIRWSEYRKMTKDEKREYLIRLKRYLTNSQGKQPLIVKKEKPQKKSKNTPKKKLHPKDNCSCGKEKGVNSETCVECLGLKNRKVERPDKETLKKIVWEKPSTKIAKQYGVSDRTIGKWCEKLGIEKPPRGYWVKNKN